MSCRQRPLTSPGTPLSKSVKPQPPGFYRGTLFPRSGNEIRGIFGSECGPRSESPDCRSHRPDRGPAHRGGKGVYLAANGHWPAPARAPAPL